MFAIRYYIAEDFSGLSTLHGHELEALLSAPIGGYIEIAYGNYTSGFYWDEPLNDSCGDEDIDEWMEDLLDVLLFFRQGHSYAAFLLKETAETWMEFIHVGNTVTIREAYRNPWLPATVSAGNGMLKLSFSQISFLSAPMDDFCYEYPEGACIPFPLFQDTIVHTAQHFLQEMHEISENALKMPRLQSISHKISTLISEKSSL